MNRASHPHLHSLLVLIACCGCFYQAGEVQTGHIVQMAGVTIEFAPGTGGDVDELTSGPEGEVLESGTLTVRIGADGELTVNGQPYGPLSDGDHVLIDQDTITVNGEERVAETE